MHVFFVQRITKISDILIIANAWKSSLQINEIIMWKIPTVSYMNGQSNRYMYVLIIMSSKKNSAPKTRLPTAHLENNLLSG